MIYSEWAKVKGTLKYKVKLFSILQQFSAVNIIKSLPCETSKPQKYPVLRK